MNSEHLPRTCKWAKPTLFLEWPLWIDAWSWEWSCHKDGAFKPVKGPADCRTCAQWQHKVTCHVFEGGVRCEEKS
jgi:hypothetical protein